MAIVVTLVVIMALFVLAECLTVSRRSNGEDPARGERALSEPVYPRPGRRAPRR